MAEFGIPSEVGAVRNKKAFYTLLISQIIFGLFLFVWIVFLGFSVMLFDAPGSEHNGTVLTTFFSILSYPAGLIAGVVLSWICYARRLYKRAVWFNFIPALWVVPISVFWGYALLS